MDRNYDVIILISNIFILITLRITNFADIIKAGTMVITTTFIDSKKVKRIGITV